MLIGLGKDIITKMKLLPIGSTAYCSAHKGTLVAYFHAKEIEFGGTDETYGVLFLNEPYRAEMSNGRECYIRHLVVHTSNLSDRPDGGY